MMNLRHIGAFALCTIGLACGGGIPPGADEPSTASKSLPRDASKALTDFTEEHHWSCADCASVTDVGLRNECNICCAAGAGAFAGCVNPTTRLPTGNLFDPLSCTCVPTAPGDSKKCGGIYCPAGGECCNAGRAPFTTQFCELPGSTIPPFLKPYTSCTNICPVDRPTACGSTCHNLLTENNNCGTCGTVCAGTGVTCGGGGAPGVCGCTPNNAAACAGHCGPQTNNCGQTVDCGGCTGTGATCGGGGTPGVCGCTPVPAATTCAGKCGPQQDNCGQPVDCGSCGPTQCQTGADPQTNSPWVVCESNATTAWISANDRGSYHATEICQQLGYTRVSQWGGTCGNVCGYCEAPTSCSSHGRRFFDHGVDPPNNCGQDANGGIICLTVMWECVK